MKKRILFSILPIVFGAQAEDADVFDLSIEQLLNYEVTIASQTKVALKHAPASVTLFTRQTIKDLGVSTLTELLNYIPGFYSSYNSFENNQSYLVTRGHAQKYAATVLFLWNGQRINEDYTGGLSYLLRHVSLHDVNTIEVIRGPGSALYGANAFNGVINIRTDINRNSVQARVGENNLVEINGTVNTATQDWNLGLSWQLYQDQGDSFTGIFDRFDQTSSTQDPRSVQDIKLSVNNNKFTWQSWFHRTEQEDYYLFRRVNNGINTLTLNNQIHQVSYQFIDDNYSTLKTNIQWRRSERESLGALAPADELAPFLFGVDLVYEKLEAALAGSVKLNSFNEVFAGIELNESNMPRAALKSNFDIYGDESYLGDVITFDQPSQRSVLDKSRITRSAYLSITSKLSPSYTLTSGIRYDDYNDVEGRLNPRLALVYHPQQSDHVVKLYYAEAYKVASLGDLYDLESGLTEGNQQLDHTKLNSWELSYAYAPTDKYIELTYFNNNINDLIGFTSGDLATLDNIGHNQSSGIELNLKFNLTSQQKLFGNFTHLLSNDSKAIQNNELTPSEVLSPDNYGSINYVAQLNNGLKWSIATTFRSDIQVVNSSSYVWLVNSHINWNNWQLMVKNLLNDRTDFATSSAIGTSQGQLIQYLPARGREISLSYRLTW